MGNAIRKLFGGGSSDSANSGTTQAPTQAPSPSTSNRPTATTTTTTAPQWNANCTFSPRSNVSIANESGESTSPRNKFTPMNIKPESNTVQLDLAIGISAGILMLILVLILLFVFYRRRSVVKKSLRAGAEASGRNSYHQYDEIQGTYATSAEHCATTDNYELIAIDSPGCQPYEEITNATSGAQINCPIADSSYDLEAAVNSPEHPGRVPYETVWNASSGAIAQCRKLEDSYELETPIDSMEISCQHYDEIPKTANETSPGGQPKVTENNYELETAVNAVHQPYEELGKNSGTPVAYSKLTRREHELETATDGAETSHQQYEEINISEHAARRMERADNNYELETAEYASVPTDQAECGSPIYSEPYELKPAKPGNR